MPSRRQFIQYGLSVLAGAALISPARSWPPPEPVLNPFASSSAVEPPTVAKKNTYEPKIKVIGISGGGGKAAVHMIDSGVAGIEFIFVNTDANALNSCADHQTIQLHRKNLRAKTKLGRCRETAELAANEIRAALAGTHLLFITVGLGGGTGTEAAPVIARIAKEMGIETVALVTMPFSWEGVRRMHCANSGLAELQSHVNTVIVLQNDRLLQGLGDDATRSDALDHANEVIKSTVVGIVEITIPAPGCENASLKMDCIPDQHLVEIERALVSLFLKNGVI